MSGGTHSSSETVVVSCNADPSDPRLPLQLAGVKHNLQTLLDTEKNALDVRDVQRWRRVRVTFELPSSAARRLHALARHQPNALHEIGITAVEVDHGAIEPVQFRPPPEPSRRASASQSAMPVHAASHASSASASTMANHVNVGAMPTHAISNAGENPARPTQQRPASNAMPNGPKMVNESTGDAQSVEAVQQHPHAEQFTQPSHAAVAAAAAAAQSATQNSSPLLVNLLRTTSPGAGAAGGAAAHPSSQPPTAPSRALMCTAAAGPSHTVQQGASCTVTQYSLPSTSGMQMQMPTQNVPQSPHYAAMRQQQMMVVGDAMSEQQHMYMMQQQREQHLAQQQMQQGQAMPPGGVQQAPGTGPPPPHPAFYISHHPVEQAPSSYNGGGHVMKPQSGTMMYPGGPPPSGHYNPAGQQAMQTMPAGYPQQAIVSTGAAPQIQDAAPPAKKRKRPTKKQQKEIEAAAAAAAAQAQQAVQQQYMMQQQQRQQCAMQPPNAHTVDRPAMMNGPQQYPPGMIPQSPNAAYYRNSPQGNLHSPANAYSPGMPTGAQQPQMVQHQWANQQQHQQYQAYVMQQQQQQHAAGWEQARTIGYPPGQSQMPSQYPPPAYPSGYRAQPGTPTVHPPMPSTSGSQQHVTSPMAGAYPTSPAFIEHQQQSRMHQRVEYPQPQTQMHQQQQSHFHSSQDTMMNTFGNDVKMDTESVGDSSGAFDQIESSFLDDDLDSIEPMKTLDGADTASILSHDADLKSDECASVKTSPGKDERIDMTINDVVQAVMRVPIEMGGATSSSSASSRPPSNNSVERSPLMPPPAAVPHYAANVNSGEQSPSFALAGGYYSPSGVGVVQRGAPTTTGESTSTGGHGPSPRGSAASRARPSSAANDGANASTKKSRARNASGVVGGASALQSSHLPNGHDRSMNEQQSPVTNGVFKMEVTEETAMAAPVMLHATPPKSKGGGGRKNRRKADLSQEASPHDDDDEFILSTTGDSPSPGGTLARGQMRRPQQAGTCQPMNGPLNGPATIANNNFHPGMQRQPQQFQMQQANYGKMTGVAAANQANTQAQSSRMPKREMTGDLPQAQSSNYGKNVNAKMPSNACFVKSEFADDVSPPPSMDMAVNCRQSLDMALQHAGSDINQRMMRTGAHNGEIGDVTTSSRSAGESSTPAGAFPLQQPAGSGRAQKR